MKLSQYYCVLSIMLIYLEIFVWELTNKTDVSTHSYNINYVILEVVLKKRVLNF